jgi:hypothetical protein
LSHSGDGIFTALVRYLFRTSAVSDLHGGLCLTRDASLGEQQTVRLLPFSDSKRRFKKTAANFKDKFPVSDPNGRAITRTAAGFSPWRPRFEPSAAHVGLLHKMALAGAFLRVFTPPLLHIHCDKESSFYATDSLLKPITYTEITYNETYFFNDTLPSLRECKCVRRR